MFERFTDRARKVMALANQEAQRLNHDSVSTEHILLGLCKEGSGVGANVLKNLGVDLRGVRREVENLVEPTAKTVTVGKLAMTPDAKTAVEYAVEETRNLNHNYTGTEHLLLGLLRQRGTVAARVFVVLDINVDDARKGVLALLGASVDDDEGRFGGDSLLDTPSKTVALGRFSRDISAIVARGEQEPVVGRDREIEHVIRVLCRQMKSNLLLVGPPGSERSAIVHGLCQRIASENVPVRLSGKRVVAFNPFLLAAGVKYQGQIEERMATILGECRRAGNVILFFEDHEFLGLLEGSGSFAPLVRLLESSLDRRETQCIITATDELIRDHGVAAQHVFALCSVMKVDLPSEETVRQILVARRRHLEKHHGVRITDDAVDCAMRLARIRIEGSLAPQAPLELIDFACSAVSAEVPEDIANLRRKMAESRVRSVQAVRDGEYETAANSRDEQGRLRDELSRAQEKWSERKVQVDASTVKGALSALSGVPIEEIDNTDAPLISAESIYGPQAETAIPSLEVRRVGPSGTELSGPSEYERYQTQSVLRGRDVEIVRGQGFVLLPHTDEFEALFTQAIAPAMEQNGLRAVKADDIYSPGSILAQVWERIRTAEVIVADMSEVNPNVIYELGLCHALHRCPILLVRDPGSLPFNIRSLRYIPYANRIESVPKLREDLTRAIGEFLAASRSPTLDSWTDL